MCTRQRIATNVMTSWLQQLLLFFFAFEKILRSGCAVRSAGLNTEKIIRELKRTFLREQGPWSLGCTAKRNSFITGWTAYGSRSNGLNAGTPLCRSRCPLESRRTQPMALKDHFEHRNPTCDSLNVVPFST